METVIQVSQVLHAALFPCSQTFRDGTGMPDSSHALSRPPRPKHQQNPLLTR